jgi:ABC-type nitrate/sulfonate/bicarbonate transport system ATPase subunit
MQAWLLQVIEKINTSVLFVTHDIEEAVYLSDRIYVLSSRPAKIKEEVSISLPKPREREIVTSQKFNKIEKDILSILS